MTEDAQKRAFIFPGQGSQQVGMGKALADSFVEARAVFEEVDDALGQKLSQIIFEGPEEDLKLTENTQPALMAVSLAVIRVLEKQGGFKLPEVVQCVAGHSLGEYAALCAAGALTLSDTARLLKTRGLAMQKAVPVGIGGMAALLGADMETARAIVEEASTGGHCEGGMCGGDMSDPDVCEIANDNSVGQIVISGHAAAIDRAIAIAATKGLKRSIKLPVSAPFHCSLMQPAADVMREALQAVDIKSPCVPVIANVTASAVTDPQEIRDLLVRQITGSVRWRESVLVMKERGITQLVECGSGNVLCGLIKRIDKEITTASVQKPEDVEAFLVGMRG